MFIKRLKPNVFDVFFGNGWNQWARVTRRAGQLQQVDGSFNLDRRAFNALKGRLVK